MLTKRKQNPQNPSASSFLNTLAETQNPRVMRPLDEKETTQVFEKLFKFTGNNLKNIVENPSHEGPDPNPGRYCFRLQKNRVHYVSESLVKRATNIKREKLVSLGTQVGKFTKGGSFHLTIQCLNLLATNAKHKVWLKPTSEMSFLYGNHVLKGAYTSLLETIDKTEFGLQASSLNFQIKLYFFVICTEIRN